MKLILLFISAILTIAPTTNERKIYLLDKKVELTAPAELVEMSDPMWNVKYKGRPRAALALSDKNGEVSLIGMITNQRATDSQISAYKDFQIGELKKAHPDLELIEGGVKTVRGRKIGYFKFFSQAIDQKIFNYYFFTIVDGKIILFNFNSIVMLRASWENKSEQIVSSLIVK